MQEEVAVEEEIQESNIESRPKVSLDGLVECLLLACGDPIPKDRLAEIARCSKEELVDSIARLRERYQGDESGFALAEVAGKLQLRTKPIFAPYIRDVVEVKAKRLSAAALETLSVIAYNQPIVKSEIEKIRGVDVSPTLKTLLDRSLVTISGYQMTAGQPAIYSTTEEFLRIFALDSLSDLPPLGDLIAIAREPGEEGEVPQVAPPDELETAA